MLLTALSETGRNFLIALAGLSLAFALCWWVARNERKYSERVRPPRSEPIDYGAVIYEHRMAKYQRPAEEWRPGVARRHPAPRGGWSA